MLELFMMYMLGMLGWHCQVFQHVISDWNVSLLHDGFNSNINGNTALTFLPANAFAGLTSLEEL
jgi:hypothetical protein